MPASQLQSCSWHRPAVRCLHTAQQHPLNQHQRQQSKPVACIASACAEGQLVDWSYSEGIDQDIQSSDNLQRQHLHQQTHQQRERQHAGKQQWARKRASAPSSEWQSGKANGAVTEDVCSNSTKEHAMRQVTASTQGESATGNSVRNSRGNSSNRKVAHVVQQSNKASNDDYLAAQQRVKQLLVSADPANPQAAANALHNTVNDIVIALQTLATAPKPTSLLAIKQYDAATQQLTAVVVQKFKQLLYSMYQHHQQQAMWQRLAGQQRWQPGEKQHSIILLQQQPQLTVMQHRKQSLQPPGSTAAAAGRAATPAAQAATVPALAPSISVYEPPPVADSSAAAVYTAVLVGFPPTKLAAVTLSLGLLQHYHSDVVAALEAASLQLLREDAKPAIRQAKHLQPSKQQQPLNKSTPAASIAGAMRDKPSHHARPHTRVPGRHSQPKGHFNANQLGQLGQGFVSLDHILSNDWQAAYLAACRKHFSSMNGSQLASLGVFLCHYRRYSCGGSTGSTSGLHSSTVPDPSRSSSVSAGHVVSITAVPGIKAAGIAPASTCSSCPIDGEWVQAFLTAAASQATSMKSMHLVHILQAAAGLYSEHQRKQYEANMADASSHTSQPCTPFAGLPLQLAAGVNTAAAGGSNSRVGGQFSPGYSSRAGSHSRSSSSKVCADPTGLFSGSRNGSRKYARNQGNSTHSNPHSNSSSSWLSRLLLAFQQQLPDMKMGQLAAALPAVTTLTATPWPLEHLQPVLLQVWLLLPTADGPDIIAAAASVAQLSAPAVITSDEQWCNALLHRLHAVLPCLGSAELSQVVQTLAALQLKPYKAWVYELCHRLRVEAQSMTSEQVLTVIEGLAKIRVQLDPEVLHLFVLGIRHWMGVLSCDELHRLSGALRLMYSRALPGRTMQQLVNDLSRRSKHLSSQHQQHASYM